MQRYPCRLPGFLGCVFGIFRYLLRLWSLGVWIYQRCLCNSDFGMTEILRWRIQRSSMVPWRFCAPLSIWYWQEHWRSIGGCTVRLVVSKLCTVTVFFECLYIAHHNTNGSRTESAHWREQDWKRLRCCCFPEQIRNEPSILEVGNLSCIHFLEDGPVCYVNGQSDVDFVVDMRMLSLVWTCWK